MPTYQYRCTACGEELEAVQKFTDPALTQCPTCEGALRKVFSAVGVVFKGSGFYATDSRKADARKSDARRAAASASDSSTKDKAGSTSTPSTSSDTAKSTTPSKAGTSA